MNNKEKAIAIILLDNAVIGSNNDLPDSDLLFKDFKVSERIQFVKEFHEWNGDPEEFDEQFLYLDNNSILEFLINKIKAELLK